MFRLTVALLYLLCALLISGGVWWFGLGQALGELEKRGQSDLALASDRLVGHLQRYRELTVLLADDPRFQTSQISGNELREILLRAADLSAALDLVLLDADRQLVAAASGQSDLPWRIEPFVLRAAQGALGNYHAVSKRFGRRAFYIAAPVFSAEGPVVRVLVTVIDIERIEADSRGDTPAVFFTDDLGVVFFSNRSELLMMQQGDGFRNDTATYSADQLRPFVDYISKTVQGYEIWEVSAGRYVPGQALRIERDIPVIGMRAVALVDAGPAYVTAGLQAAVVAAVGLLFGAVLLFTTERRRALARANEVLEERVTLRTHELSNINQAMRGEIAERREAELALKKAQDDLVQIGKLSALGQMSAGISHELNQPLMAIQSFAENGARFLAMGREDKVEENLGRISSLAARMARIIKNLRAFARQESEPASRVDLCGVVRAAVEVSESRLQSDGVTMDVQLPHNPVWVNGGEVRLQQVVINLISNAIDAMNSSTEKSLTLIAVDNPPSVTVRDTGPGISDPDKIFEPFYSTKSVGEGEGTGLGLSISYGLVQSFGGKISCENGEGGGAIFTVRLQPWSEEAAA